MISTKIISFFISIPLVLIIIFIFGGCANNRTDSVIMTDSTPTSVKMLIGWGGRPYTLIELVHNDVFEVTVFSDSLARYFDIQNEVIFNEALLDNFVLKDSYLYEIFSNPFTLEPFVREIIDKGEAEFSQQQWDDIWYLVENISSNDADRAFEWAPVHGLPYVWAIIDGSFYWSLLYINIDNASRAHRRTISPFINNDLILLAYELIHLSPVLVGGEHNPVIWPEEPS